MKAKEAADAYNLKESQRINISNSAYLELIEQYQSLYNKKKTLVETQIERYREGIGCVKTSSEIIHQFTQDLDLARPQLEATRKEIDVAAKVPLT